MVSSSLHNGLIKQTIRSQYCLQSAPNLENIFAFIYVQLMFNFTEWEANIVNGQGNEHPNFA